MSYVDTITIEDLEADPYPIYAELRRTAPVAWVPALGCWVITSWEACETIGGSPDRFKMLSAGPLAPRVFGEPNVITVNGAPHSDIREGIDPSVAPRRVLRDVDDIVQPIAQAYVEKIRGLGQVDLTTEYFEPVSGEALRYIMGLDSLVDTATFVRWFQELSAGSTNYLDDPEVWAKSDAAGAEIDAVIGAELDRMRASAPEETMLSQMVHAGRAGAEARTNDEIIPSVKVIILGGAQEPGHGAASSLLGLLKNPEQLDIVLDDPEMIPAAVDEGLRWIAPIGMTERQSIGDQVLNGQTIREGEAINLVLASANRDEARFENPDQFNIERRRSPHQAFGHGAHFCAGHFFARHVERIMLEELLPALPNLRLDPDREVVELGFAFRAPKKLPVVWDVPAS